MKKLIISGFVVFTIITSIFGGFNLSEIASDEENHPKPVIPSYDYNEMS